ncbi:MAG TPA: AAA family ATPase, partial [Solirubrobacteraceae bacterium]|nr:AAA family ATPase [Solirubrobacteraceae bacterium]
LAALRRVGSGHGEVILLSGEPGIGKTALAQRLTEEAERLGVPTVWGLGGTFGQAPPPYWHWAQVARSLIRERAGLLGALGPSAPWLTAVAPELAGEIGPFDATALGGTDVDGRFHIYDALQLLLTRAAGTAGLVVVLDDLHLADEASLQALAFIATGVRERGVLVIATYREGELRAATGGGQRGTPPLLAELVRSSTRVSVAGLERDHVRRLIDTRARADTTDALVERMQEVTGGNPLFVTELLSLLQTRGRLDEVLSGRDLPLPSGVSETIAQRLAPLPASAREALATGAVIGTRFRTDTLARAAALAPAQLLEPLDEAVGAGLLRPTTDASDSYAFSHGLVQATLYESLPRRRRCEIHAAVGRALEHAHDARAGEGLAEIAYHFLEAAPVDGPERALEYARRAADQAVQTFAYDEAVTLYKRALELLDATRSSERLELLQALGEAQMRVGDTEAARASLQRAAETARSVGDADALGRAALASNIWGLTFGIDEQLVRLTEEAVAALERGGSPGLLACAKGLLATALYWSPEVKRRERLAHEALELARQEQRAHRTAESARVLAYVLGRYLLARWGPRSVTEDYPLSDELVELTRELGASELEVLARSWRAVELVEMGRFSEVDHEIARLEHIDAELRQPRAMLFAPLHRGSRAGTIGRFEEAECLNAESYEIGLRVRGTIGELAGMAQMLSIRLQQGRLAELEEPLRALCSAHPTMAAMHCALALALVQSGRPAEARSEL